MYSVLATCGIVGGASVSTYYLRRWLAGGSCQSDTQLYGKTAVITGANTGIGKETAIDLAKRGATFVMACRDMNKGENALNEIKEKSGSSNVFLRKLDLSSLKSIHEFCDSYKTEHDKLHILVNNAGVMMCPYQKTEDGFEMQLGVNHLGHFALTNLLLGKIVESAPSRIVNVSSRAHKRFGAGINFDDIDSEKGYDKFKAYSQSKLANILFTKELNRKITGKDVTVFALHPGVINSELFRHFSFGLSFLSMLVIRVFGKTCKQGAQTSIYCAVEKGIENQSGMYFSDCKLEESSEVSHDEGIARKLWEISEAKTGVIFPY